MSFWMNFTRREIFDDIFPILWYFAGVRQAFGLCHQRWLCVNFHCVALTQQAASQNPKKIFDLNPHAGDWSILLFIVHILQLIVLLF